MVWLSRRYASLAEYLGPYGMAANKGRRRSGGGSDRIGVDRKACGRGISGEEIQTCIPTYKAVVAGSGQIRQEKGPLALSRLRLPGHSGRDLASIRWKFSYRIRHDSLIDVQNTASTPIAMKSRSMSWTKWDRGRNNMLCCIWVARKTKKARNIRDSITQPKCLGIDRRGCMAKLNSQLLSSPTSVTRS